MSREEIRLLARNFPIMRIIQNLSNHEIRTFRILGKSLILFYLNKSGWEKAVNRVVENNSKISGEILKKLETDANFWKEFALDA